MKGYKFTTDGLPFLIARTLEDGVESFGIDEMDPGQVITIEIIEISQTDLEALPEWEP